MCLVYEGGGGGPDVREMGRRERANSRICFPKIKQMQRPNAEPFAAPGSDGPKRFDEIHRGSQGQLIEQIQRNSNESTTR